MTKRMLIPQTQPAGPIPDVLTLTWQRLEGAVLKLQARTPELRDTRPGSGKSDLHPEPCRPGDPLIV